jgi:hypothetical protein
VGIRKYSGDPSVLHGREGDERAATVFEASSEKAEGYALWWSGRMALL